MGLAHRIEKRSGRALVFGEGTADFDEFVGLMNRVISDKNFSPGDDVLVDFTGLSYSPSVMEIRKLGMAFKGARRAFQGRVAFVVHDKVQLKLGRFASLIAGLIDFELSVFENMAQADAWLNEKKDGKMDELKSRIVGILGEFQMASLATVTAEGSPWVRYVTTRASNDLKIRFATPADSRKVAHIRANPKVHLTCGGGSLSETHEWVQVEGEAFICVDLEEKIQFWNNGLNAYFNGPDDPQYTVITITPTRIEYMTMDSIIPQVMTLQTEAGRHPALRR